MGTQWTHHRPGHVFSKMIRSVHCGPNRAVNGDDNSPKLHSRRRREFGTRLTALSLLTLIILLAGWIIWQIGPVSYQPEPTYLGKPLTVWLQAYQPGTPVPQSDQALRAMGTNCLPTPLRLLLRNDSPLLNQLGRLAQHHGITNSYSTAAETWHLRADVRRHRLRA